MAHCSPGNAALLGRALDGLSTEPPCLGHRPWVSCGVSRAPPPPPAAPLPSLIPWEGAEAALGSALPHTPALCPPPRLSPPWSPLPSSAPARRGGSCTLTLPQQHRTHWEPPSSSAAGLGGQYWRGCGGHIPPSPPPEEGFSPDSCPGPPRGAADEERMSQPTPQAGTRYTPPQPTPCVCVNPPPPVQCPRQLELAPPTMCQPRTLAGIGHFCTNNDKMQNKCFY